MPFESEKQRRFLYAKKPAVAQKFAKHGGKTKRQALLSRMKGK
jgi:hypothetical protein